MRHQQLPPCPPREVTAALEALRAAFRDYHATLTDRADGTYHFEVTRRRGTAGPWCLVSTDPREIWEELRNRGA